MADDNDPPIIDTGSLLDRARKGGSGGGRAPKPSGEKGKGAAIGGTIAGVLIIAIGLFLVAAVVGKGPVTKPEAGAIGVIRNGGPLDNRNIRGVVKSGAGLTWSGLFSTTHYYPVTSQQRFIRLSPDADADGPPITVPTKDGVEVTIQGTFYMNTVFDNTASGLKAMQDFDTQFSTRTFGVGDLHPYDGRPGFAAFLTANVLPSVRNNLRQVISGVTCYQLVSSCALVQNQSVEATQGALDATTKIPAIEDSVQKGLDEDLKSTLGQPYFRNIKFSLSSVTLPQKVQEAIENAQASFALISKADAEKRAAKIEAQANLERQRGYNSCSACAQQDILKAIPSNVTTYAPGGAFAVTGK
ncbi:MAG: SPFH domain-containing protein [Solirubrobacteraceae bacterium]|nr:SPFH domain-containing protein [Solirubrobacteraceae bacterium]